MATVRCPSCGEEIRPFPIEREDQATTYVCPSCREGLTIEIIEEYLFLEEEEASG